MSVEQYDRLSILYADAHKALAEAHEILTGIGPTAGLGPATDAAWTLSEYLCDEIERHAPHSVKVPEWQKHFASSVPRD